MLTKQIYFGNIQTEEQTKRKKIASVSFMVKSLDTRVEKLQKFRNFKLVFQNPKFECIVLKTEFNYTKLSNKSGFGRSSVSHQTAQCKRLHIITFSLLPMIQENASDKYFKKMTECKTTLLLGWKKSKIFWTSNSYSSCLKIQNSNSILPYLIHVSVTLSRRQKLFQSILFLQISVLSKMLYTKLQITKCRSGIQPILQFQ